MSAPAACQRRRNRPVHVPAGVIAGVAARHSPLLLRCQAACVQKGFRRLLSLPQRKAVVTRRLRRVHSLPPQCAAGLPFLALLLPEIGSEVCPLLGKFPLQLRQARVAGQAAARLGVSAQPLYLAVVGRKGPLHLLRLGRPCALPQGLPHPVRRFLRAGG